MEYLQIFDENKNMLNEKVARCDKLKLEKGKNFMIVLLFIENDNHEFLIQKTSKNRDSVYATTGGHVTYGDDNIKTVIKEAKEELGLDITKDEIEYVGSEKHEIAFCDIFYIHKNIDLKDIIIQEEEVDFVYWLTKDEIYELDKKGQFRHSNIPRFEKVLEYIKER